jgi:transcriptional regulator with XRE-family HTH domain
MHPVDQTRLLTTTMSPGRVGRLVARARRSSGLSERRFAEAVGTVAYTVRLWEMGDVIPTDVELNAIARVCGLRVDELLTAPDPVAIDFDRHVLRVATAETALTTADNDEVLNAYVWLVRQQRSMRPGEPLRLRAEDLDILATQLDLEDADLEARLTRITGVDHEDAAGIVRALISRRVALPVAGVLGSIGLLASPAAASSHMTAALAPPAAVAPAAVAPAVPLAPSTLDAPPTLPAPAALPPILEPTLALVVAHATDVDDTPVVDLFAAASGPPNAAAPSEPLAPPPAPLTQQEPLRLPPPAPASPNTGPVLPPPSAAPRLAPPVPALPSPSPAPVLAPPLAFTRSLPPPPPPNS